MKINLHNIGDKIEESSTENELSVSLNSFQIATGIQTKIVHIKKTLFIIYFLEFPKDGSTERLRSIKNYQKLS
uniref:hypothetical protein n=1 Tax=Pectobacterium carotovorum TaxID=554 RepID=UPI0015E8064B|nr:hypothetical protein [Pectobacterium carotovorum]